MNRIFAGIVAGWKATDIGPCEAALLSGLGLVGYGAGVVYRLAGFIVPGVVVLSVAIVGLR
jgi:hypothetical protein